MSFEEFLTLLWSHFIHNVICFPATFLLLRQICLCFVPFALSKTKNRNFVTSTLWPMTKACPKLALPSTDHCAAFTQSRYVKQYQLTCYHSTTSSYWLQSFHSQPGKFNFITLSLRAFTCSKLTVEIPEQGVRSVQS